MNDVNQTNNSIWPTFFGLFLATIVAQLANVIYQKNQAGANITEVLLPSLVFLSVLTLPSIYIGLTLGKSIGVGLINPELSDQKKRSKAIFLTIGAAIALGALLLLIRSWSLSYLPPEAPAYGFRGVTGGLLVSIGAAIGEEVWFRFGLLTLLFWVINKRIKLTNTLVLICIFVTSCAFAAAHLPQLHAYGAGTTFTVWGTMLGNIAVGVLYGWSFWRYGLLVAILAHFSLDIVLHVVPALFPLA